MADNVIGGGTLRFDADGQGLEASLAKMENSVESFEKSTVNSAQGAGNAINNVGNSASKTADKLDAQAKRLMATITRMGEQAGIPRSEYLENRARAMGIYDQPGIAQSIVRIRQSEQVVTNLGMSAKQTAQAMRMLPAQFTDIATSIAGGMPFYLIAIQQGGQIRDSFGGIGPALKGITSLFTPLRIAIGAGIGALGLLVYAWAQGTKETNEFNRALINTGNYIGMTSGQLSDMASAISRVSGTQAQAAQAITSLVNTGQVSGDVLQNVATAMVQGQRQLGMSVEETGQAFASLAKDPVKASEELNRRFHYLTLTTYDQIAALVKQKQHVDAVALAMNTLAGAVNTRAEEMKGSLGTLERSWRAVKDMARAAWDAMLNLGREKSASVQLAEAEAKLADMTKPITQGGSQGRYAQVEIDQTQKLVAELRARVALEKLAAESTARNQRIEQGGIEGSSTYDRMRQQYRSKSDQMKAELETLDRARRQQEEAGKKVDENEHKRLQAQIREQYKEKETPVQDSAATRMLLDLKQTERSLVAQLELEGKLGTAAKARVEFEQLLADLKGKTHTEDQASLVANADKIREQLKANEALEQEIELRELIAKLQKEEADAERKFRERAAQLGEEMFSAQEGRDEQYGRQLGGVGLSDSMREQIQAQESIYREFRRFQNQLARATPEHLLQSDEYIQQTEVIKQNLATALEAHRKYYSDLQEVQENWQVGATQALFNYLESVNNVAQQTNDYLTNVFEGAENAFAQFVTTGKGGMRSLIDSWLADLARLAFRRSMSSLLTNLLPSVIGSFAPMSGENAVAAVNATGGGSDPLGMMLDLMGQGRKIGNHATGLDYVPYDGYLARLHKGEEVVPASERGKRSTVVEINTTIIPQPGVDPAALEAYIDQRDRMLEARIYEGMARGRNGVRR